MTDFLYLITGIGLATLGAEILIRASQFFSTRFGVPPLLSGLVIVGFGTSMPELVVSTEAALSGQYDIAVGNVVGSNIANIFLILGLCAVISPLSASRLAIRRDATTLVGASLLFVLPSLFGVYSIPRMEGFALLLLLLGYVVYAYRTEMVQSGGAKTEPLGSNSEHLDNRSRTILALFGVVGGLAVLILGSKILISGAVGIAHHLNVSEALIGLTFVAVGTSMPELIVSVIATIRRQGDLAIGNIIGSNIFNLLGILGLSACITPLKIGHDISSFDQWVMLFSSLILFGVLLAKKRLVLLSGVMFLSLYFCYSYIKFS
jgi:cation:H+ antiporter